MHTVRMYLYIPAVYTSGMTVLLELDAYTYWYNIVNAYTVMITVVTHQYSPLPFAGMKGCN